MSLLLVRHGQAMNDRLSETGREQARLLGRHWAEQGIRFDRVYVGPRNRHRETHDFAAGEYAKAGLSWPEPDETRGLDEYPGFAVVSRVHPDPVEDYRTLYRHIVRRWVAGEIRFADLESWGQFRARVHEFLLPLAGAPGRTVAFTSAGAVAASTAFALGLNDLKTLELSFSVRNTGCAELAGEDGQFRLVSFNAIPHLKETTIVTD